MSLALVLAAALNAQPTPAPCIPDLQAGPLSQQPRPCSQPKPILMAVSAPETPPVPVPPIIQRGPEVQRGPDVRRPRAELIPVVPQQSICGEIIEGVVARQAVALRGRKPAAQYAVARQIDGCMVPAPVGYRQDYLLPPEPKPADAPPRRR